MAVVSIQRILNTNDCAVLEMEYRNIINNNNLKLGSIEADNEIITLYQELMNTISGKTLSIEAAGKLQANYDQWAEKHITQSVSGASGVIQNVLKDSGKDAAKEGISGFMQNGLTNAASKGLAGLSAAFTPSAIVAVAGAVAVSCVSQYYAYQNAKLDAEFRQGLVKDILKIEQAERELYNKLQSRLLDSAWRLLRQYKLPDEYRIVQKSVDDLFRAVNETDTAKRRGMLRALENEFRVYPPYWIYRAETEQIAGDEKEAAKCFDEFDKVWRPVLRNDVWKVEAEKFRVIQALNSGDKSAAMNHLETICSNVERSDWADNIFAGLVYYMLGENEKAVERVEVNVNFGFGMKTSKAVLEEMKSGKMDIKSLSEKLSGLNADLKRLKTDNIDPAAKLRRAEVLLQQKAGDKNNEEYKRMADVYYSTKDYKRAYVWYYVYGLRPGWHFFNDELNDIEGTGIFTFAKLDSIEFRAAQRVAQNIIREIQASLITGEPAKRFDVGLELVNAEERLARDTKGSGICAIGVSPLYVLLLLLGYVIWPSKSGFLR